MSLTPSERQEVMRKVLQEIWNAGYVYDLNAGNADWPNVPPPRGTRLNCRAAARLAKRMGEERGVDQLQLVSTHLPGEGGFFIPADAGRKALGTNDPPVRTPRVRGWEFDNHFRVKDGITLYDPVFGTSGGTNLVGVKCTSTRMQFPKQISVYGGKYKITRTPAGFQAEIVSNAPVRVQHHVSDKDYR